MPSTVPISVFFTLKEANDILVNEIAKMPIFKFYSLTDYGILASVDGQKIEIPGRNEIELEIHNQCTRLIANCIIFYNASILSL